MGGIGFKNIGIGLSEFKSQNGCVTLSMLLSHSEPQCILSVTLVYLYLPHRLVMRVK